MTPAGMKTLATMFRLLPPALTYNPTMYNTATYTSGGGTPAMGGYCTLI